MFEVPKENNLVNIDDTTENENGALQPLDTRNNNVDDAAENANDTPNNNAVAHNRDSTN